MEDCIRDSDVILVVCTPKLKARWEKTENPDFGHGATFEGALAAQYMYDNAMRNSKVFPIIPDGGRYEHAPDKLRPWWNWHCFPSKNDDIWCLIFNVSGDDGPSATDGKTKDPHRRRTAELLGAVGARLFREAVVAELAAETDPDPAPNDASRIVDWFSARELDQGALTQHLNLVHRALLALDNQQAMPAADRSAAEKAAAALYCLAACRLVNRSAHPQGEYVVRVPRTAPVIYAVIATAVFGGTLELRASDDGGLPCGDCMFHIQIPAGGHHTEQSFERAAYLAVFPNQRDAPKVACNAGPLTDEQKADLIVRLQILRDVRRKSLALVITGQIDGEPHRAFAARNKVPVMVPDDMAMALLRIKPEILRAHIEEFCSDVGMFQGSP